MSGEADSIFEHIVELQPGGEADIEFRFAMEEAAGIHISLAGVDLAAGTAELVVQDLWGTHETHRFAPESGRWMRIRSAGDGNIHATVRFGSRDHLAISSDLAYVHSLELNSVMWERGALRLTFLETA